MEKKQYQKPLVNKVNLRITESVLTACKTNVAIVQPNSGTKLRICTQIQATCVSTLGS